MPAVSKGPQRRLAAALCGVLALASSALAQEAPPAEPEPPQRDEKGLEARRQRYAPGTPTRIAMLPVRLIELPFRVLDYPVEHWIVRKRPRPLTQTIGEFLVAAEARGVSVEGHLESGHSGIGGGIGYRLPRQVTGPVHLRFFGGATNRGYQQYYVQLDTLRGGAMSAWLRGQFLDLAEEDFYGIGLDTSLGQRSTYELEITSGVFQGSMAATRTVALEFDMGFTRTDIFPGEDENFPVTQSLFSGIEGLEGRFDFIEGGLALTWDRRDSDSYAGRGSYVRAGLRLAGGVGDTDNGFAKYILELRQYLPLPGARRVLGLRLAGSITDNLTDRDIPFFRLERLGGSRTLRGVQTYRFTDKDMLRGGVEYRFPFWYIGLDNDAAIDALVFYDFGTVKPDLETVQWRDIQSSGGFGFRIVARRTVFVRTDFAWSREDSRVHLGFGRLH
jgi:hypothetical protein